MQIYLIFFLEGHYFLDIQYVYIYIYILYITINSGIPNKSFTNEEFKETFIHISFPDTVCPKSIDPFYVVTYKKGRPGDTQTTK